MENGMKQRSLAGRQQEGLQFVVSVSIHLGVAAMLPNISNHNDEYIVMIIVIIKFRPKL